MPYIAVVLGIVALTLATAAMTASKWALVPFLLTIFGIFMLNEAIEHVAPVRAGILVLWFGVSIASGLFFLTSPREDDQDES